MAQKVIFFTAGPLPTVGELADIAQLNAAAKPYDVIIANGAANAEYGAARLMPCDFVAGVIPTAYSAKTTIDPDDMPVNNLPSTKAVVTHAQVLTLSNGGTATLTISGGVITATTYAAP